MGVSYIRYDFRWRRLSTENGWLWNIAGPNRWNDLLEPSLKWTKQHGMRTLVNLLAYKPPRHARTALNAAWQQHSGQGPLDDRDLALWAAWAAGNGIALGVPSPKDYAEALVDALVAAQAAGEADIVGFCILNEPNTMSPAETTYTTADYCNDLLNWVKRHIRDHHAATLGHTKTVVNLYPFLRTWRGRHWRPVAENPNLDVLGIDIYWDQWMGLMAWGVPWVMGRTARRFGKDWWLVETAGANGPWRYWKDPSCRRIERCSRRCLRNGVKVLGYYRLWGDFGGNLAYAGAYNIHTDPGTNPTPQVDGRGESYWKTIRDL
jgi:hypothetical protein